MKMFPPFPFLLLFSKFRSPKLVIADMGCGEAKISQSVPNKVFSFDLVAFNDLVTACDMAKVVTNAFFACCGIASRQFSLILKI
jgi:hypothetical protein